MAEYDLHPSIVKIDVEGAEVEVLRGMASTLISVRPAIVFEARDQTLAECCRVLSDRGYKVEKLKDGNYLARPDELGVTGMLN